MTTKELEAEVQGLQVNVLRLADALQTALALGAVAAGGNVKAESNLVLSVQHDLEPTRQRLLAKIDADAKQAQREELEAQLANLEESP